MKAAGTSADGVQGLELRLGRLAPQHAGGDIFNVRHGLRRKVDLEPDTPVHLLQRASEVAPEYRTGRLKVYSTV